MMTRSATSVVIRYHGLWLSQRGAFENGVTLEESREFNSYEDAMKWITDSWSHPPADFDIMYYCVALAEEDQEYAAQLEDLRG